MHQPKKSYKGKIKVVVGLFFGDEGKGRTVDYLLPLDQNSLSFRFSGGHQVGHTVMIEKEGYNKHIHSNFGSGTLRGIPSYYGEYCTINQQTLFNEHSLLVKNNIKPILYVHPLTMITTAYDVAYNRFLEWVRLDKKHGSVGLGFGTTINRTEKSEHGLYAIDTNNRQIFREKIKRIKKYYDNLVFSNYPNIYTTYLKILEPLEVSFSDVYDFVPFEIKNYSFVRNFKNIVFEGSQGILLDQKHGVFPNVTYANTTSKNAIELYKKHFSDYDIEIFYVTRTYITRHGNGWVPNEKSVELINNEHETCEYNQYQGALRCCEMDYDLLNHSLFIDNIYSDGISKNLVITCNDQRKDFSFDYKKINKKFKSVIEFDSPYNK